MNWKTIAIYAVGITAGIIIALNSHIFKLNINNHWLPISIIAIMMLAFGVAGYLVGREYD